MPEEESSLALWLKRPLPMVETVIERDGEQRRVRIARLRQRDVNTAREKAQRWAEDRKVSPERLAREGLSGVIRDLAACELIALSCHGFEPLPNCDEDAPKYPRLFRDGLHVAQLLTPSEVRSLFGTYMEVQHATAE
jgi:hypothetical protein